MEKGITNRAPTHLVLYNTKQEIVIDKEKIPGLSARYYKRYVGPHTITMGVYQDAHGRKIFRSWGVLEAEHCCRFHQVMGKGGRWLTSRFGQANIRVVKKGERAVGIAIKTARGEREFIM